jgi:hypothetical protein
MRAFRPACGLLLLCSLLISGCLVRMPADSVAGDHTRLATLPDGQVRESSGLVQSTRRPDIFWTHDDSGGPTRLTAFRLAQRDTENGRAPILATVTLRGARNVDWEDIAHGPAHTLFIFDGGDNPPCTRTDKRIYRLTEPDVDPNATDATSTVDVDTMRFEYPDEADPNRPAAQPWHRYDAEALAVHPATGDLYIVTKRSHFNIPAPRVYRLAADRQQWNTDRVHVLEHVADLARTVPGFVTGMDIDPSGRQVAIRTYDTLYLYTIHEGKEPFKGTFQHAPQALLLPDEPQGEAIAIATPGPRYLTTSEQTGGLRATPVYEVRPANATDPQP